MSADQAPRCNCGRPVADAFLCSDCTGAFRVDLEALTRFVPELSTLLARQARTSGGSVRQRPEVVEAGRPEVVVPAQLRTADSQIALPATAPGFDVAASEAIAEVRVTLFGWCRHLAESRGVDLADVLAAA